VHCISDDSIERSLAQDRRVFRTFRAALRWFGGA
jgi:hypothetical protein